MQDTELMFPVVSFVVVVVWAIAVLFGIWKGVR